MKEMAFQELKCEWNRQAKKMMRGFYRAKA
jgi:hypothetical protein